VQQGLELRFSVTLASRFSPAGLAEHGQTLCLALERARGGGRSQLLCLAPAAAGRRAARLLRFTGGGRPRAIAATIARPSARSLVASFTPAAVGLGYRPLRWQVQSGLTPAACRAATQTTGTGTTTTGTTTTGTTSTGTPATGAATTGTGPSCPPLRYPARPALARLHQPRLAGCVPSGPSLVFHGSPRRREIAIALDDGPWPDPPTIDFVRLLARYHAPATFFEIGEQISEYDRSGAVERLMLKDGDMIGDHTWTHPDMTALSAAQQTSQLELTARAIRRATGFEPCLWRPPYGAFDGPLVSLARRLGMLTIMWDVDPRDWALPGTASIEQTVIDNAHNGAILELHFGGGPRYQTYDALPDIITTLRRRGDRFVNIATMLGLRLVYR
jgi:peptidoglycan/xylan/chitin deacetylase (PgdA/CDA1 family)